MTCFVRFAHGCLLGVRCAAWINTALLHKDACPRVNARRAFVQTLGRHSPLRADETLFEVVFLPGMKKRFTVADRAYLSERRLVARVALDCVRVLGAAHLSK